MLAPRGLRAYIQARFTYTFFRRAKKLKGTDPFYDPF